MQLVLGGASQGKLQWVLDHCSKTTEQVADGETIPLDAVPDRPVLNHLHRWVFRLMQAGMDPAAALEAYLNRTPDAILICDEIGCGVVPMHPLERAWREQTGRLCCRLAGRAGRVVRIFCGLPMTLKEEAPCR